MFIANLADTGYHGCIVSIRMFSFLYMDFHLFQLSDFVEYFITDAF